MVIFSTLLAALWVLFILVWIFSAFRAKRTVRRGWMGVWWRLAIIVVVVGLMHYHVLQGRSYLGDAVYIPTLNVVGLVLTALGIALAIWARLHLGRNWGMPMAVKENPELVTSGPYRWLRNPIYTGILLAALGSSFIDWWWTLLFVWSAAYFIIAAHKEEKLMLDQFPDSYPAYRASTWALLPGVW